MNKIERIYINACCDLVEEYDFKNGDYIELIDHNIKYELTNEELNEIIAMDIPAPDEFDVAERYDYTSAIVSKVHYLNKDKYTRRIAASITDSTDRAIPSCPSLYHFMIRPDRGNDKLYAIIHFRSNDINKFLWDQQTIAFVMKEFIKVAGIEINEFIILCRWSSLHSY